jgi:predicted dehydrogenase
MQNVGIIGLGGVSPAHLRAVENVATAQLVAVADINRDVLAKVQNEYRCRAYSDYRELLHDAEIDLVIVCLPHFLHTEASVAALEAGKHVLVEKPMAINVEQCDRMIEAANTSRKKLTVGHMQHFFPPNGEVKRLLDDKELGSLVMIREEGYRPFGLERAAWYFDKATQGGLWYQNGIHLIDRCCWWTGSRVIAVKAMIGSRFYDFSADDVALATLHFENGVFAVLIHVWWKYGASHGNTEFICTEGMMRLDSQGIWIGKTGQYEQHEVRSSVSPFDRQLEAFITAIERDTEPPVTPEYARELVRVMVACLESSQTGREVLL